MDLHIPNTFRPMRRDSSTKHEDKLGSYDLMPNAKSYGLFTDNKGLKDNKHEHPSACPCS